ncbi:DUF58 domain-containing protein [Leptolyngbya sp. CCY15150]|uniref:DUF58 domain-containing protein n=1 Tax=Leptolyngbya sp. CCY15150 TaxID=2767772 RepID=UPI00194DF954|nr:DUF58 domain-containing protein [Leptolyngbya sp. CCY15150]
MIPSRQTYLILLLVTALGVGLATLTQSAMPTATVQPIALLLLGVDIGIVVAMILDSWRVRPHRVTVERSLDDRLSIGRENLVQVTVTTGDRPAVVQLRDTYPAVFTATPPQFFLTLPAHHQETLTYTIFPTARGDYAWGKIYLRQRGAWGLGWDSWTVDQARSVAVFPDLIGLRSLSIRLTLQTSGSIRRARRQGMGTEFAELRDYGTGDDPRLIDWKATARRNRPLIRVLEPEQEQTLMILLDRGRLMTAQVEGLKRFDWALNATLSLSLAALQRGDRVGVGVFDRQMHRWIPPDRGSQQLPKLLRCLTPIQPVLLEPDYLDAVSQVTRQQTRRALVVLLTDIIDQTASSDVLSAMGRLTPRYLPFCVALRDPYIDRQAQAPSPTVEAGYARAVALDLLQQRHLALALLQRRGALILDAPAHQITDQLVDRYLQLKARSQL